MTPQPPASLRTKFGRFDWEERRALAEALLLLALAAPLVRLLPLALIGRIAAAGPWSMAPATPERGEVLTWIVAWSVDRAARRSPFRAKCFEQGLAAQIMLRRRGIDATLFYGVGLRPDDAQRLRAHVWIETERFPVIGAPEPGAFALLATWPTGRRPFWAKCRS